MTNRAFSLTSDVDKQKKLNVILRKRTGNALTGGEMQAILKSIKQNQQYRILVHTDPESFAKALVLVRNAAIYDYGEIILGQAWFSVSGGSSENGQFLSVLDTAAAQIVRYAENSTVCHALHIYIPTRKCKQEGRKHEKR